MFAEAMAFHASSMSIILRIPFNRRILLMKASMMIIVTTGKRSLLSFTWSISKTMKRLESRSMFLSEFSRKSYRPPR